MQNPRIASLITPNLGFTPDFYKRSSPSLSPTAASSDPVNKRTAFAEGSFEAFKKSGNFQRAKDEIEEKTLRLIEFANSNCSHTEALKIFQGLNAFLGNIKNPSFFGRYEKDFYKDGKALFDDFYAQIQNEQIPLDIRLGALSNLAIQVTHCGPSIVSELQNAVSGLNFTNDDVHKQAKDAHSQLIEACLQDFVRDKFSDEHFSLGRMETHYVTEFKRRLNLHGAAQLPRDPYAPNLSVQIVEQARGLLEKKAGPCQLALLLAQTYLQTLKEKLPNPFEIADLKAAQTELNKQFGSIPLNVIANSSYETGALSIVTNPGLLAKNLLDNLTKTGQCAEQPSIQILGWSSGKNQNRSIEVQGDCIACIREDSFLIGEKPETLTEYSCVTIEDLKRLYDEVENKRCQLPNTQVMSVLLLMAIDNAEPSELADFDPSYLCHDQTVLDAFVRKCTPEQAGLWVKKQIGDCTQDQKLLLLRSFADHGKADAFSAVLQSVAPNDRQSFLDRCDFSARIDQAVQSNNAPLLKQWLGLLSETPASRQRATWLQTSQTLSHILKTGSSSQVLKEYFRALCRAKSDRILSPGDLKLLFEAKDAQGNTGLACAFDRDNHEIVKIFLDGLKDLNLEAADIRSILEAKNGNDTPGFFIALQNGHAETVKIFLDALPNLGLDNKQILKIVEAKRRNGTPGLLMALQDGHAETVKIFLDALPSLGLDKKQILKIVEAKRRDGVPGLLMAFENGHAEAVKVLLDALPNLGLDNKQILKIVEAKEPFDPYDHLQNGTPGLYMALQNGHAETVRVFLNALPELNSRGLLTSDQIFHILGAKRWSTHMPGLHIALSKGRADAIKVFLDALSKLKTQKLLTTKQILEIVEARPSFDTPIMSAFLDRTPGLVVALQNGHHEAVESFLTGLQNLGLDQKWIDDFWVNARRSATD